MAEKTLKLLYEEEFLKNLINGFAYARELLQRTYHGFLSNRVYSERLLGCSFDVSSYSPVKIVEECLEDFIGQLDKKIIKCTDRKVLVDDALGISTEEYTDAAEEDVY